MNSLELFCGTKSFSKVAETFGIQVCTTDIDEEFDPSIIGDILTTKIRGRFSIIWASPPCEGFSVASIGYHWNKDNTPKTDRARLGLALLGRTLDIIKQKQPLYWFIENPRGKMRKIIDPMFETRGIEKYRRETVLL